MGAWQDSLWQKQTKTEWARRNRGKIHAQNSKKTYVFLDIISNIRSKKTVNMFAFCLKIIKSRTNVYESPTKKLLFCGTFY